MAAALFDSPVSSQIRCKELAERGDPEPAGAGRRRRQCSPCAELGVHRGLPLKAFWGGKIGKRGFPPPLPPRHLHLFPCASWIFGGSQPQESFTPFLIAPMRAGLLEAPNWALSVSHRCLAKSCLCIYLLNPPLHSPLRLISRSCCSHTHGFTLLPLGGPRY